MEAVDSTLSSIVADNTLVSFLIAALVPAFARALYHFLFRLIPTGLYHGLTRYVLHREVVSAKNESTRGVADRTIDGAAMMEMILGYIGYLTQLGTEATAERKNGGQSFKDAPFFLPPQSLDHAAIRYAVAPNAHRGSVVGGNNKRSLCQLLQEDFRLSVVPSQDVDLEVEPGMFVRYVSLASARTGSPAGKEGLGEGRADTAADYLYYDLFRKLHRRRRDGDSDGDDRGPFGSHDSNHSDEEDEDSDAGESVATFNDQAVQMLTIHCHAVRGARWWGAFRRLLGREAGGATGAEDSNCPGDRISLFLERARSWYLTQIRTREQQLYLYYPSESEAASALKKGEDASGNDEDRAPGLAVRRYPFPPSPYRRTFDSLFFQQRDCVIRTLADFANRTGKYGIPGAPRHMTWLLHGSPGTGKTSLVNAMAHHLKRHVVVLQLGNFRTQSMLCQWMSDVRAMVSGEMSMEYDVDTWESSDGYVEEVEVCERIRPHEVVYLLEDIDSVVMHSLTVQEDAAGPLRDLKHGGIDDSQEGLEEVLTSENSEGGSSDTVNGEESDDSEEGTISTSCSVSDDPSHDASGSNEKSMTEYEDSSNSVDTAPHGEPHPTTERFQLLKALMKKFAKDRLDVQGLLKVLTGLSTPEGRIVVMTTNHLERLDPRLYDPSVVNMKINMTNLSISHVLEMISHYYPDEELTPEDARRITAALQAHGQTHVNPARMERLCAECDALRTLVVALEHGDLD